MEVGSCMVTTDAAGRELTQHGTAQFPVGCYHDDLAADWVPWHWHEEWEAVVVSQGAAVVAAGEEKQTLQAGQACFVNSGVLHAVWGAEGTRCRLHSLVFHPRLVGGGLDSVFWQEYVAPLRASPAQRCIWLRGETPQQRDAAAAIEASRLRLRPIVMTSLCFILGVIPLALSSGAGAGAQNALGTVVMAGMLTATALGIYFTPLFFVLIVTLLGRPLAGGGNRQKS